MSWTARAIDACGLFLHATTAGHLAAAELRHQLSSRLGVTWTPVENAMAEIEQIPDETIRVFSSRAAQIENLTSELGWDSPEARQVAAYQTRAPKTRGVDPDDLRERWALRAAETGLTPERITAAVLYRQPHPIPVTGSDEKQWFTQLSSPDGVTKHTAVFDRRNVIQHLAGLAGDRLPAADIEAAADAWLATRGRAARAA